jgi:hypothetical protein
MRQPNLMAVQGQANLHTIMAQLINERLVGCSSSHAPLPLTSGGLQANDTSMSLKPNNEPQVC